MRSDEPKEDEKAEGAWGVCDRYFSIWKQRRAEDV